MSDLHGFELVKEREIPEINSKVRLFRHIKTNAELLSVENDDENKCFAVSFATPPDASDGIAHIMEHSVLGGSRKYPVKDPFAEMLKGSMATFINAFTFPDKTMYPVASTNLTDFYNLVDVYLDAVFFPNITPQGLAQEGWHYELDSLDAPLTYKGVVFNEMKGAYSSPESLLGRYAQQSLLPDTPYSFDSGGDPAVIPDLTFEKFKHFHETYYHPSNARIYFWGDDDPVERLRIMDEYLSEFEPIDIDASVPVQTGFDEPQRVVKGYDAGDGSDKKGMLSIGWGLPEGHNPELVMALNVLEETLLGNSGSPLRKALIDSGLGEDLVNTGFSNGLKQMVFSVGMKGIDPADAPKVEALIIETLGKIANEGIDPAAVEAAVNSIEFALRELNTGGFPRGLALSIGAVTRWLHGGDPLVSLAFAAPIQAVKKRLANEDGYLEGLLKTYILDNTHRATTVLEPDPTVKEQTEAAERARLEKERAAMSEDDLKRIMQEAQQLLEMQNAPDSPEALSLIPSLERDDLDKSIRTVPQEELEINGTQVLLHDLPTNGILYLDVGFNLKSVPQDLLPYLSLFGRALVEMGTESHDFVQLQQRIGSKTGGISPSRFSAAIHDSDDAAYWLFLRGKATLEHVGDLTDIMRDIVLTAKFDDKERFRQIATRAKAAREARLIPSGHSVVASRLNGHFSEVGWFDEVTGGLDYLFFLRDLLNRIDDDWENIRAALESIREHLLHRDMVMSNATVEADSWSVVEPHLEAFIEALPVRENALIQWKPGYASEHEGLTVPAQVNYVGQATNLYDLGYELHGSAHVIMKSLSRGYMWNRVRLQGGAYCAFAQFSTTSGVMKLLSYRDPNLLETIKIYGETSDYLRTIEMDDKELTKAIVGMIGSMDAYQLPDAKGFSALTRTLTHYTDEKRQQIRDEVLGTTVQHFRTFGEAMADFSKTATTIVLGSSDAITKANETLSQPLNITKLL